MKCESLQKKIMIRTVGSSGLSESERQHLAECPSCMAVFEQTRQIEQAMQNWLIDEPSAHLKSQIAATLSQEISLPQNARSLGNPMTRLWRRFSWKQGLTAAMAAAVMICWLLLTPQSKPADALALMNNALQHVHNAHVTWWVRDSNNNGPLAKGTEEWYQNGVWREVRSYRAVIIKGGKSYTYNYGVGQITSEAAQGDNLQDFTMQGFLRYWWKDAKQPTFHTMATLKQNGRTVREVLFEPNPGYNSDPVNPKHIFYIDNATNLPISFEALDHRNGQPYILYKMDFRFNEKLPANWFDPKSLGKPLTPDKSGVGRPKERA